MSRTITSITFYMTQVIKNSILYFTHVKLIFTLYTYLRNETLTSEMVHKGPLVNVPN